MSYYIISEKDLPQGYSLCPINKFYNTLWDMMDDGLFPKIIPLKSSIPGVDLPSTGWLEVEEGLYDSIIHGLYSVDPIVEQRIVSAVGWPLEKKRALILNFFRYLKLDMVWTQTLRNAFLTIVSIALFGDQNPKLRRKQKSRLTPGVMLFLLAQKLRSKIRKMNLSERQVTGKNLVKDLCLIHSLNLQKRLVLRGTMVDKRFFTHFEQSPPSSKVDKHGSKNKHLKFLFDSDLDNLKVHPKFVNLEEHWEAFESVRERLLDTSFEKDWPVVGRL
ncbi:nonstructural protein [Zaliv Terpeniya virus]|uniref:Nonstructural protein n=1 Tax=Zaliv Terpeniya virus TaxID=2748235 RepID=I1T378_9VIRU|nr:nonstructural protein [Zaliv Terpeniya virus]AEL29695.1 nonstructural protein [Zaliv Terpeniya virus]